MFDRVDNMGVAGATAEIAVERMANLVARRRAVPLEELDGSHYHAWRTVPALETVALPEAFLDRMELSVPREALYGRDLGAVGLDGEHRAWFNRLAINEDRAGAADAGLASNMCSGKPAHIAQELHEQTARFDLAFSQRSIDADLEGHVHSCSLRIGGDENTECIAPSEVLSTPTFKIEQLVLQKVAKTEFEQEITEIIAPRSRNHIVLVLELVLENALGLRVEVLIDKKRVILTGW
jgi:hypothetical protein